MADNNRKKNPLLYDEDWWTVWFGLFFILLATILGMITLHTGSGKLPPAKLGHWVTNPFDALYNPSKSEFDIKTGMTASMLVSKINDKKGKFHAELIPDGDLVRLRINAAQEKVLGQAISVKAILKDSKDAEGAKLMSFASENADDRGLGADTYTSKLAVQPDHVLPVGKLTVTVERSQYVLWAFLAGMLLIGVVCSVGIKVMGGDPRKFLVAFMVIAFLAAISFFIQGQKTIKAYGLGYAFWALLVGLLISNTIGTPKWLLHGVKTEMYIKTGLVLLGAEILFGKILSLGVPGLMVAWIVTPVVVIFMYFFGVKVLKMVSKPLVIIIAMATSVCGVSAAIAAAGASRAKKEELTLGVGMTLIFTVIMMILMPLGIKAVGMSPILGGAWIGGTVDSTGAVVAAGAMLGQDAETVAAVVKMVQNVLIGVIGFVIAVIWVTRVDRDRNAPKPKLIEIWTRFPKFIVGFVAASILFSFVLTPIFGELFAKSGHVMSEGLNLVEKYVLKASTTPLRGIFFCLAFVSIGLESNFRDLASQLVGGKPIILYIVGQTFNLILTLFIAWLAFIKFFPNAIG